MKVIGILLILVAGLFGMLALGELGRYSDLSSSGNPFNGLAANSFIYLAGIAAVALLCGFGFLLMPGRPKPVMLPPAQQP